MSIPGVFAAVEYDGRMLVDGGVLCNFPIAQAREQYPDVEIIGIQLGKFEKNQKVKSLIDNVLLSYQVMSAGHLIPNLKKQKSDRIVLVISGGGMRGFYGL